MQILKTNTELEKTLFGTRRRGIKLGFVPTMGALHKGHMALVRKSVEENDHTIVSIFINPRQFNRQSDFEMYPVSIEKDKVVLEKEGCDFVYIPDFMEIYPHDFQAVSLDLQSLNKVFEGPQRPGHFDGVVQVVNRLFQIIKPNNAYFGLKDYQQCLVIKLLRNAYFPKINLHFCQTERSESGLALSSRNLRLSEQGRHKASNIYKAMMTVKSLFKHIEPKDALDYGIYLLMQNDIKIEYFQLANAETLQPSHKILRANKNVLLIAAYVESVRLIDNIVF